MFRVIVLVILIFLGIGFFSHGGVMAMSNPFGMVVAIVAIAVFGGVLRELVRGRKDFDKGSRRDLEEIKQRIAKIEADIADIKEQIADFIIRTH